MGKSLYLCHIRVLVRRTNTMIAGRLFQNTSNFYKCTCVLFDKSVEFTIISIILLFLAKLILFCLNITFAVNMFQTKFISFLQRKKVFDINLKAKRCECVYARVHGDENDHRVIILTD